MILKVNLKKSQNVRLIVMKYMKYRFSKFEVDISINAVFSNI